MGLVLVLKRFEPDEQTNKINNLPSLIGDYCLANQFSLTIFSNTNIFNVKMMSNKMEGPTSKKSKEPLKRANHKGNIKFLKPLMSQ
jgi:hypothetical protein